MYLLAIIIYYLGAEHLQNRHHGNYPEAGGLTHKIVIYIYYLTDSEVD